MAYAEKLPSGKWRAAYRVDDVKKYTPAMATKRDAMDAAKEQERHARMGDWIDPKASKVTVAEWSERWFTVQSVGPKTLAGRRAVLDLYVLPRWGDVTLDKIKLSDVRHWIATMRGARGQELAPATVRKAWWILQAMLGLAVEDRLLRTNAALDGRGRPPGLPKGVKSREHVYLTVPQLGTLARATDRRYRALVWLMGTTGLRPGEAVALRVSDFDMLRRRVKVNRAYTSVDGRMIEVEPKTHERREVAFPKSLADDLARAMFGKGRDDLVFPAPAGGPLEQRNLAQRVVAPAVRKVRNADPHFPTVTPYSLRHTAASLAIAAGATVKAVQRMMGHASAAMTLDTYAGLFDQDLDDVANRIDQGLTLAAVGDVRAYS